MSGIARPPLAAVTLDAAGTLLGPAEPVGATYARLAARHGVRADADAVDARFRRAFAAAPPLAFPGASPAQLEAHERAWWLALVRQAFGGGVRGAQLDAVFADCWAHYARAAAWRLYPDVAPALTAVRARGLRLAVVSNADARLATVLAELGLDRAVDAVICSARVGAAKPDPGIFRVALRAIGATPERAIHVGDSPVDDVQGAHAAGLAAVLVDRDGRHPVPPAGARMIRTLAALADDPAHP